MQKIILSLVAIMLLGSCKKAAEIREEIEKDKIMSSDNHLAEDNADDISVMSDEAYSNGELRSRGGSGGSGIMGDTVKIIRNNADSTLTIDFGSTGIIGKNGKVRKGKVIIKFTGGYWKTGAVISQTFDNYFVNGHKVEGSRSITNKGVVNGIPSWEIQSNLIITKTGGSKITWNSTRTRSMTKGYGTASWTDDEYNITGSASGMSSNGDSYSLVINNPLFIKLSFSQSNFNADLCKYILDGKITYTRGSRSISLNYGYGGTASCDNQGELDYNGTKYIINL